MDKSVYEEKLHKNNFYWMLGVASSLVVGVITGASIIKQMYSKYDDPNIKKIVETYELMQNEWYFGKDYENYDEMLTEGAIKGMLDNEDPYTFYTSTEAEQGLSPNKKGCGFSHVFYGGNRYVADVHKNSPADRAGMKKGDVIYGFYDGDEKVVFKDLSKDEATSRFSNHDEDSITLFGNFSGEETEMTIEKGNYDINIISIDKIIEDNKVTAVVDLETFLVQGLGNVVYYQLDKIIDECGKIDKVIIDLRDNGGGYVQAAVDLASIFVPDSSLILTYEFKDGTTQNIYSNKIGKIKNVNDIVIIQNANTASASETFTIAMRDLLPDVVTTVGTVSYGKGIVQSFHEFSDGSVIRYTMAKSYSPNGYSIHGIGVTPDILKPIDPEIYYMYFGDAQVLSKEMKDIILKQINVALEENYDDYLTGLHAFQQSVSMTQSDEFTRDVAQILQKMVWDNYLQLCDATFESAMGV